MFIKSFLHTCSIISLSLSPLLVAAETDPDFTDGVLTMPRVVSGDTLYENVGLQLDFVTNTFSVLSAEARIRFESKTNGIDEILIDKIAKLTWVNGSHGCKVK